MKLKQKLQNLIEMKKPNDTLLNEIANLKTKLVSAPSIDYETYSKLSDIENSVYRYNNFLRNGMQSNADNEAKKLMNFSEDEDITLQGGISNTKYIWCSSSSWISTISFIFCSGSNENLWITYRSKKARTCFEVIY